MKNRVLPSITTVLFSCLLASCGGGSSPGPAPVATATPAAPTSRAQAFLDAQTVLAIGKFLGTGGYVFGTPAAGAFASARDTLARRTTQVSISPCAPGGVSGVGSTEVVTQPNAIVNLIPTLVLSFEDFYDASCQNFERIAIIESPLANTPSSGSAFGATTITSATGAPVASSSFTLSYTGTAITIRTDAAPGAQQAVPVPVTTIHSGATCIQAPGGQVCGIASFGTVSNVTSGFTESVAESFGAGGVVTAQITAQTDSGTAFALVAPTSGAAWALSGATPISTVAGNASVAYNGSIAVSGTYTLTDSVFGIAMSGTLANAALHITLTRSGVTLATIGVDGDGNGNVTYADGSTNVVAGFTMVQ
jgi:hypothetical protein